MKAAVSSRLLLTQRLRIRGYLLVNGMISQQRGTSQAVCLYGHCSLCRISSHPFLRSVPIITDPGAKPLLVAR